MEILKNIMLIVIGFSSGVVISGAVFAFISIIGIVPRLAQKTKTGKYIKVYEESIMLGGIFGAANLIFNFYIPLHPIIVILFGFAIGVFYGCLAVSLAEILDVIPIITRRIRIQKGLAYMILSLAIGKCIGSILYFFIPGFYRN